MFKLIACLPTSELMWPLLGRGGPFVCSPFDKNRRQSQSRSGFNGSSRRQSPASRPQSQSPTRNKYDKNNRGQSKEKKYQDQKRSASNSSQHWRQQQGEQMNGPPLPSKGHISSEAGKQAINLNIGDQNQFYQCAATRYCQKRHIPGKIWVLSYLLARYVVFDSISLLHIGKIDFDLFFGKFLKFR